MTAFASDRDLDDWDQFHDAKLKALIKGGAIKTNKHGDWEVTFLIHQQDTAVMLELTKVVGIPIELLVRKWRRK